MNTLFGLKIIESPLATETVFSVQKWPTKKKRRGYCVRKEQRPCMYVIEGSTFVVHPSCMVKLRSFHTEQAFVRLSDALKELDK